jgi:hypothetical protein
MSPRPRPDLLARDSSLPRMAPYHLRRPRRPSTCALHDVAHCMPMQGGGGYRENRPARPAARPAKSKRNQTYAMALLAPLMTDDVRPCDDCGTSIAATKLGRPRLRCDDCRASRAAAHLRLWYAEHPGYMARWRAAHPGYSVEYYWSHEGQQRAERRERHRADHPKLAAEQRGAKNSRRRARRAANLEQIRAAEQLYRDRRRQRAEDDR